MIPCNHSTILYKLSQVIFWFAIVIIIFGFIAHFSVFSNSQKLPAKNTEEIRVATYNVHYIVADRTEGNWSLNDWERRKEPLAAAVNTLQADIIGFL